MIRIGRKLRFSSVLRLFINSVTCYVNYL